MDKKKGMAYEMSHICAWFMYLSLPRQGELWITACLLRWKDIHAWEEGRVKETDREGEIEREWWDE